MNPINSAQTRDEALRFKFRDFAWSMRGQCGFFLVFAFFFVLALRQDSPPWFYAFLVSTMCLLLFTGYATVSVQMDILVDATGISRCIGRKVIKKICWDNVRVITVFDSYDRKERRNTIGINIFPRNRAHPSSVTGGKVAFGDNPMRQGRFTDLIDLVNKYVVEHQINVESTVGGVKTSLDRIDLR